MLLLLLVLYESVYYAEKVGLLPCLSGGGEILVIYANPISEKSYVTDMFIMLMERFLGQAF